MAAAQRWSRTLMLVWVGCLAIALSFPAEARKKKAEPVLNAQGEKLAAEYSKALESLKAEVAGKLPAADATKKSAFLAARAELAGFKEPEEGTDPKIVLKYKADKAAAEAKAIAAARELLKDLGSFLADDSLDDKLVKLAVLSHGTPAGLAEFAQQSPTHKALLDRLFADPALMKQMVVAGGANGGEYGESMQVYTAILKASERASKPGVFQKLALGTALHQPWLEGEERGSVNGTVFTDHKNPDGQVKRYLHYEKAYLDKELDPAFKGFTAWEFRFVTNDPYTNKELAWGREMLRKFRPDHITNPDHSWRYVGVVKSDLPYCSTRHDPSLGMPKQQALALGGICGRRAFFGRFITRAFGIPARRSTQTGHAAMNMWTPNGWVVRLGAWWSMNWCGPWGGMDFYLDSQARAFPKAYLQVLRAQWIGDALGEADVSLRRYGQGGGFWDGFAFYIKRAVVEDNNKKKAADQAKLAKLSADEARLLGESDKIIGKDRVKEIKIPEDYKKVLVDKDGTITVPAVACTSPTNNNQKISFLKSWDKGMQIHYQRLGGQPELLRYTVEAPAAGKYEMSALVSTVSPMQAVKFRLNRRTIVDVTLPYTKGAWEQSKSATVELRQGRNSIMVTFRAPNRGVSIKAFQFKPVK